MSPQNNQTDKIVCTYFAIAANASEVVILSTLNMLPGALVFHRIMLFNIPFLAGLHQSHTQQQIMKEECLQLANLRCSPMHYDPDTDIQL